MIDGDVKLAQTLVDGHLRLLDSRITLWRDIAAKYRCHKQAGGPDEANLRDPIENGSMFGVFDTKAAATTPQRPRGSFTPTRKQEPWLGYAQNRDSLVNSVLRARAYQDTLRTINVMARTVPHVFLKASWDWRDRMPRFDVLPPTVCFFDEAAESPLDVSYIIHRRFLRKHELMDRVDRGIYPQTYMQECQASPRGDNSRLTPVYGPDEILPCYEVFEIHDLHGKAVYHYSNKWRHEFLLQQEEPEQLFCEKPFFCLSFNEFLDGQRGLSDGEVLRNPAERLSRLDAIEYKHAKTSIPMIWVNPGAFQDPKKVLESLTRPTQPGQIFEFALADGHTWASAVGSSPTPNLPMAFATARNAAAEDLAYRAGLPAYMRGQEGSKVATELALQQQSEATRRAWDVLKMQSLVTFAAQRIVSLYEEHLDEHEVLAVADDDGSERVTEVREVYRRALGLRDPAVYAWEKATGTTHQQGVDYFYTPEAYEDPLAGSPTSRLATYQALFSASNVANPMSPIDGRVVAEMIRRELKLPPDFIAPPPQAPPAPGGAPAPGAMPPLSAGPTDPVSAGGMPAGVPSIPTPAIGPMVGGAGSPTPTPKGQGIPGL